MEAGMSEERRGLLAKASVGYGLMGNDQSTQNVRDINYHINNGKTAKQPRTLKASLKFPGMANREHNVANAYEQTGRWFLETKQYLDWEAGGRHMPKSRHCCGLLTGSASIAKDRWQDRLLWIKGNAGAGKSTLMKMAVEHAKKIYMKALILPHFFNARGNALERSTEGMYRTLLYWILEKLPQELETKLYPQDLLVEKAKWEVPELIRLLEAAMEHLRDRVILFYVDALDECDQKDIRGMLEVFRRLVETTWKSGHEVRVCFASRPFPHYTFNHAIYLDISEQEEHDKDIAKYIKARLNDGIATSIRDQVQMKAAGVFMWVVLVVDMLNEKYDAGYAGKLEELVKSIPAGLYELYGHILERHPGDEDAMLECFRWLLFANGFNEPDEMWWMMQLCLGLSDEDIQQDFVAQTMADRMRYIVHMGKGLVKFVSIQDVRKDPEAEFIHESVREFILDKDSAVLRMYGVQSRDAFKEQSHQRLRDSWFKEWVARRPQLLKVLETKGRDNITGAVLGQMSWYPATLRPNSQAALWATHEMLQHAEYAQQCGISQTKFLNMLSQYAGPYLVPYPPHPEQPAVMDSLAGILIVNDCSTLIRETQREPARRAIQNRQPFGLIDEGTKWSPVSIALNYHSRSGSIDALLGLYLESEPRDPGLHQVLQYLADNYTPIDIARRPQFGQLLDLSSVDPLLASFFIIALAPTQTLDPHLKYLQQLVDKLFHAGQYGLFFSHTLLLFAQVQLESAAIDIMGEDILHWLESKERQERHADEGSLPKSGEEGSDEEGRLARRRGETRQRGQIYQRLAALIKARGCSNALYDV